MEKNETKMSIIDSIKDIYLHLLHVQSQNQAILTNQAIINAKIDKIALHNSIDIALDIKEVLESNFNKTSSKMVDKGVKTAFAIMKKKYEVGESSE